MNVLEYKPCRAINSFRQNEKEDSVAIVTFDGFITLQGAGKLLWVLADGKHSIKNIIEKLIELSPTADFEKTRVGVFTLVKQLQAKGILIANWDPILKNELPQEVIL
ncbi:MAG: hypothetical protein QM644_03415 [Mobilitalea sp.]